MGNRNRLKNDNQVCAWLGLIIYKKWMGDVGWPILYFYTTFLSVSRGFDLIPREAGAVRRTVP